MDSSDLPQQVKHIFAPGGTLQRSLPSYEARPGQVEMAMAVARLFGTTDPFETATGQADMLAVEAETGIGKTLAYLIPAALSGRKVVISTGTLNLQEQILKTDIPFLIEHVVPDLTALCVKGRQNYLCLYRWKQLTASGQLPLFENSQLDAIGRWLPETKRGDRAELDWLPDNSPLWRELSANSSQCLGAACPENETCFITRLRREAARSQLIIVNHHLFFSDLAIRRFGYAEVLPRYESVIFDEAHHLENIATRYFGITLSHYQLIDLAADIEKLCAENPDGRSEQAVLPATQGLAAGAAAFLRLFPPTRGRFPLQEIIGIIPDWPAEWQQLETLLSKLSASLEPLATASEIWNALGRRCAELLGKLKSICGEERESHVYWFERREKTVILSASPIDIAFDLQEHLYHGIRSVVFTSATLTTGGNFSYFFGRLGLPPETTTMTLKSPFDYAGRTRLFVPENNFPEPTAPDYPARLQQAMVDILHASNGRALLLFTSFKMMHAVHPYLELQLPYPLFMQGTAPKQTLIERFSDETHSVLLAVASFWEGVNIPGDTLSCVIIDKLPFEVPSDPVIMARINKIREDGGNPFIDFQVPRAILTLRQGLGRLMRSTSDAGLLAIMDVRLFRKQYGRLFRKSLPESPLIRSLDEVYLFFDQLE